MAENPRKRENAFKPKGDTSIRPLKLQKRFRLNDDQKRMFYQILKRFLKEPNSLQDGEWDQDQCGNETLEFVYGRKNCNISVMDSEGKIIQDGVVATLDIYLNWRKVDNASLSNLQRVQNELRFLGAQNEKLDACFYLAKLQLAKEPLCGVQILCDDIVLSFSAKGKHKILVIYDDKKNTPMCTIAEKVE